MSFSFHVDAEKEFNAAIDYYEEIESGLGFDFAIEVHSAIQRAVSSPGAWAIIDESIRRSLVHRFPYGILYSVEQDKILVLAVMHLHRHPDYWKDRKK
ncbi:MAG: type II toxin-antitoxin system RelE/ParE family toxin [Gammaproteobacteria bacterium]|nr:type II toxin-antitoxin system RelE/ParE family toxin [Gammaproteobacteria bacterium]